METNLSVLHTIHGYLCIMHGKRNLFGSFSYFFGNGDDFIGITVREILNQRPLDFGVSPKCGLDRKNDIRYTQQEAPLRYPKQSLQTDGGY